MKDFEVRVLRYGNHAMYGFYVSKVYGMRGNEFLVYDPGEDTTIEGGFEWVDFTEIVDEQAPFPNAGEKVVTLFEE